jgi:hypothetical protein
MGVVKLSLVDQAIGVAGLAELAETLKTHPVLMSLDVGGNPIGKPGAAILAEALQVNHVLSSLYFVPEDDGTGSAAAVAEAIVEALSCNSQLQDNRVAERGAEAARCKAKLTRYLETAQADINAAVQAQAQLEAQMQRKQAQCFGKDRQVCCSRKGSERSCAKAPTEIKVFLRTVFAYSKIIVVRVMSNALRAVRLDDISSPGR